MIDYRVDRTIDVLPSDWREVQEVSREAFVGSLVQPGGRTEAEIDEFLHVDDFSLFFASRVHPNTTVGVSANPDQIYYGAHIARAYENDKLVGVARGAHNISGKPGVGRLAKTLLLPKNYVTIQEVAVRPAYQRDKIATVLGLDLLSSFFGLYPATAYGWPEEENGFVIAFTEELGFVETGRQDKEVFGEGSRLVSQARMQAPNVMGVRAKLSKKLD